MDTPDLDILFAACAFRHLDSTAAAKEVAELQNEVKALRETIRVERESRQELFDSKLKLIAENEMMRQDMVSDVGEGLREVDKALKEFGYDSLRFADVRHGWLFSTRRISDRLKLPAAPRLEPWARAVNAGSGKTDHGH